MNPANFSNVGGGMNGGVRPHNQMQLQQKQSETNQVILNQVGQALQAQGQYSGWRADVNIKERAVKVYQMLTSLRLIQPRIDIQHAAHAALTFEQKAFKDAREKVDYERECNEKLHHIRDTRARQAAVMQGGIMPQGPAAGMPGVGQSPYPPRMNQSVPASQMSGQQQMQMGMGDLTQQAAMQQRQQSQQQHQNMLQQQQQQQPQQPQPQQQRPQQRPGNGSALSDDLNTLSAQEYDQVCRVANQIISKTPQEDLEKIKVNLQNMTPEQRGYLARKNMDPITYFFRSQALNQLRRHKRSRMEMARAPGTGVDPNSAIMGDPMHPQRQMFQNMMNLQRNSFSMGGQQNLDPSSFIGNVENIQGQQADGLRSQEAGQLVVPASSSQMNQPPFTTQQNMFPVGGQLGQNAQGNMNGSGISPQFIAQQHAQNAQNMQQDRPQQASQFPAQPQAQNQSAQDQARVQAAAKVQFAMSHQNQPNARMQHQMTQQSPAMPMLNRPMAPGQMSPAQVAAQVRPPSRPPGMGQPPASAQTMNGQTPIPRPQIPPNLPPAVQEQLNSMSNEQLSMVLLNNQRRAMANNQAALARANASQQSMPMQQNLSQSGQGQQMVNGQMMNGQMGNGQNLRAMNLQQIAGMAGAQQPNQMLPNQMSVQQRQQQQQQQRQQDAYKLQILRQHGGGGGPEMSQEQVKEMDRLNFPPAVLNSSNPSVAAVPKNLRSWGQLKQWVASNPQPMGGLDLGKLIALQRIHLLQIASQSKDAGRNPEQGSWMPMQFQGQPQPLMNPQLQAGQQQMPVNMPPVRSITAQELQLARVRLGSQAQNISDEQLRDLIMKNRQRQMHMARQAHVQQQALVAQQQAQQAQQAQPAPQAPVTVPPNMPEIKQESQPPQLTAPQTQQSLTTKAQAQPVPPVKSAKGPPAKQAPKRKLQNDEPAESQSTTPTQKPNQPATSQPGPVPAQARSNIPFTREQLASMSPQQRAAFEAHLRRQQLQGRGSVNRASAEESWNNLPEKIRQVYNELSKTLPQAEPVPITSEQKAAMSQQIRDTTDYLGRMDALVQFIAKVPGQERNVRSLLQMRVLLMRQFKAGPDWALNDQITVTPDYFTGTTNYIKRLFHHMIARVNQQQNQPQGQRPGVAQGAPVPQATQPNMPALNASNLQQLQQQEEALQRARRASSQTVSGAAAIPQAPFGAPSPQGVPHAYGPASMPPEQLKLPPPKKRKQSHAGALPASGTPVSKTQSSKPADFKSTGVAPGGAFKCGVPDCQNHYQGFATQNALDKHVEEAHKVEEPIDNPLEFALESFRNSLIKEEDRNELQGMKGIPQASGKPGTTSSPSKNEIKLEGATPVLGSATPMARAASQLGPKPGSPTLNQQLTPRTSAGKAPTSSPLKPTTAKDGKKEPVKPTEPGQASGDAVARDPWADSAVSLEAIQETFLDFGDEGGLGFGAMDEFLNPEMFTNNQAKDTPDSVETGLVTQTPKDSELPKLDDLNGKKGDMTDDNWIPADWISFPGRPEDGFLMNDSWEDFDWDMVDRKDGAINVDDSAIAICAI
ncbi:hypothetical protein BO70DRAFT_94389 [Aspergillus heteromorphus CBS 117.55]|uniref:Mediator complex subunit 15 KIX domain-containing protein n=1 Tax=Aspergillus heteromorphus CBS 117.55 TaxID=1448321 RepID=A0A317VTX8_9EURO|nr:uncharacterized protein BO70DRAFT_94389 [Aspergillus heteromorphus CBS 117.55]PWY76318.1 hypothetical protein BO70DRAFT_94389 [Aspergillus heteromorphus CBS 117.55]